MYEILKKVITSKRYELTDMLRKIDTLWAQGDLDDEQRTELIALAAETRSPLRAANTSVLRRMGLCACGLQKSIRSIGSW